MKKQKKTFVPKVEVGGSYLNGVTIEVEKKGALRRDWLAYNFDVIKYFDIIKPYLVPVPEAF